MATTDEQSRLAAQDGPGPSRNGAPRRSPKLPQALDRRVDVMPVVEHLRPLIVEALPRIEEDRRLPQELVDAMWDAGIFYACHPREYGGSELHLMDYFDLLYELSRINGSVGWVAFIQNGSLPLMAPEVMQEMHDRAPGGRWICSGSHGRIGRAQKVEGGYRFTGHWVFASGSPWATWMTAFAHVFDESGDPVIDPFSGQQQLLDAVVARDEVTYLDGWDSLGLRGTNSGQFRLDDHFVPDRFTTSGMPHEAFLDRRLYRWTWLNEIGAVLLGMARGALDTFADLASRRKPGQLAAAGPQQLLPTEFSRADAMVRAAHDWMWSVTARGYDLMDDGNERERYASLMEMGQTSMHASEVAKQAVDIIFDLAGSDAVRVDRGIERYFRDINTGSQHTGLLRKMSIPYGDYRLTERSPDGPTISPAGLNAFIPPPPPPEGTWSIDPMHSSVGFAVRHHAVGTFRASFTDFDARYYRTQGRFKGSAQSVSLKTFDGLREHLLGEDYLDAERFPEIAFRSTSVLEDGHTITIEGAMTMKGVTRSVTAHGVITGPSKVAAFAPGFPDTEHIGLDLEVVIDRRDFGIDANNELLDGRLNLGWDVTLRFSLELSKSIE